MHTVRALFRDNILNDRSGRAAVVHNFMRGLSLFKQYPMSPFTHSAGLESKKFFFQQTTIDGKIIERRDFHTEQIPWFCTYETMAGTALGFRISSPVRVPLPLVLKGVII